MRLTLIIFSPRVRDRSPFSWAHAVKGGPVFTCFTNCRSELHLPASPGACIVPLPLHRTFSSCLVDEGLESKCIFPATIACISGQEHFSRTRDFTSLIRRSCESSFYCELIVLQVQFNNQYSCSRYHWDQCRNSEKKTVVWVLMVGYAEGVETRASLE